MRRLISQEEFNLINVGFMYGDWERSDFLYLLLEEFSARDGGGGKAEKGVPKLNLEKLTLSLIKHDKC